jgi:hypothetical protein
MKKITLLITCAVLTTLGFSQNVRFGIDPGLAMSRGSYDPDEGIDRRLYAGFDGGALVNFGVTSKFGIQAEANFSQVGVELNNGTTENTLKLQYLTIPALAKVNVCGGFDVLAGPQVGFLLGAKNDPSSGAASTDIKDYFKSTDFDLVLGVQQRFGKAKSMFIGARYVLGLAQVAADDKGFEMKNRWVSFRLGYMF